MIASITPAASLSAGPGCGFAFMPGGEGVLLPDGIHALPGGDVVRPLALEGAVAAVSPDGRLGATLFEEKIVLWDLSSGEKAAELAGSLNPPVHAEFSPDGSRLVSAGDRFARVWDAGTGKCLAKLKKHDAQTSRARFSPDGSKVLSTAEGDYAVKVWDAAAGTLLAELVCPAHEGNAPWMDAPMDAVWGPGGREIFSAANYVGVWDADSGGLEREIPSGGGFFSALAFVPGGDALIASVFFMEGEQVSSVVLRALDPVGGEVTAETQVGAALRMEVSPDGRFAAADAMDSVEVYELS